MLLVKDIRDNKEQYIAGLQKRGIADAETLLNHVIALDDNRKQLQGDQDEALAQSNSLAKQIGQLMKNGQKEEAESIKQQTSDLKTKARELGEALQSTADQLQEALYNLPNVPLEEVPAGKSEADNEVVKSPADLPTLPDTALPHWDLVKAYDIIDFELGVKLTGAGFPVYKREGARIQRAMINFFLDEAIKAGYHEVQPPVLINEASGYGTGQLPDKEGQMYHVGSENFYLIPTAEVPITNMYRDQILDEAQLPIRNVGYTPCFRREAGSWGAHVRGLNRLHQFDKVEIVHIEHPAKSMEALDQMCNHVAMLLDKLELPYRILKLCAGDLGFTSAITYDFEVYSAAQKRWLECSSVSNFKNYQANRLKLRYKDDDNQKHLLHTLNGSALALPRILAALLENNQTADGIAIPKALHPYTGFERIEKT